MGFRGGDLAEMPWNALLNSDGSVRREREEVSIKREQKTGKFRDVILNPACVEAIEWYLKKTGIKPNLWCAESRNYYVFPSKLSVMNGKPVYHVTDDTMGRILQKARKAVGIPFSVATHSLRKTYGYQQYKQGKDITLLMREFNHSSPAITLSYIGITSDVIYEAHQTMENNLVDLSQY
jgi:site-specific recombinase XerD